MLINKVNDRRGLRRFVYFVKELYRGEKNYVFPFFRAQMKELCKVVLQDKTYHALICERGGRVEGRILYTVMREGTDGEATAYFSFFDFYNDIDVARGLFCEMQRHAAALGAVRVEGPYCPYDPDVRRGVLTNRFEKLPSVFLTYNYPYYTEIYEALGLTKLTDTLSMTVPMTDKVYKKAERFGRMFRSDELVLSTLSKRTLEDDIRAVADIMASATTEINYESAPTADTIRGIFKKMRLFIRYEYVIIARERATGRAVGFIVFLPELNQAFRHFGGRIRPIKYLCMLNRIDKVRGWLQYIIPEYQGTSLLAMMFSRAGAAMQKDGIREFEGGTIVEANAKSYKVFECFDGYIDKVYRIYDGRIGQQISDKQ
jgi:hypothetical protein